MEKELLTTPELCKWLKIGRVTAWRWRNEGMPFLGQGKRLRYEKSKVMKWLNEKSQRKSSEVVA